VVLDCPCVHQLVVLDWSEFSIFLLYEEERRGVGAFRQLDGASGSVLSDEL